MSTRIDPPERPVDDDDWFATAQERPVEFDQRPSLDPPRYVPPAPTPPDLGRRQAALVLAVLVAVFLVLAGIVLGRATKSSSTEVVTVTASQPEASTDATTGPDGSAAATTPDTTTPDSAAETPDTGTSTTPATSTPGANAVPTGPTLRPDAKGSSVIALQKALTSLGYEAGTADGTYGEKTAQAVAAFQTAKGLTADGLAGAKTVAAINAALATG